MPRNFKKNFLVIGFITMLSVSLSACAGSQDDEPVPGKSGASSTFVEKGPQPTRSSAPSGETKEKSDNAFADVLSQAPSGSQYAEVDITADGKPELLIQKPDINQELNGWSVVEVYDSHGEKYTASVTGREDFWIGAAGSGGSRAMLQTTADHTGLLYSTWMSLNTEVKTQLWHVDGTAVVDSGKEWKYPWKGGDSGIQDEAPEDLKGNIVDIEWEDIEPSSNGSTTGKKEQQAQQSNSGRSKADFPYFTSGRTGTAASDEPNNTTPEFGRAVYDAFISHWIATGDSQPQLQVTSPRTGQTYTMTCVDRGEYSSVLCSGGNNAKVYIYHPIDDSVTKPMNLQYG